MKYLSKGLPAAMLFVFVFLLAYFSAHSSQTWTHLAVGKWICAHRALPDSDPFSYTARSRPWHVDDWMADVIMSKAARVWGGRGLVVFKAGLIASSFVAILVSASGSSLIAAGVLGLAACAAHPGFTEIPGMFDLPLLALLLMALRRSQPFKKRLLWIVAAIQCVWANLHPVGAAMGLIVVGLKVFKVMAAHQQKDRAWWLGLFGAALAGSMLHPQGWNMVLHLMLHPAPPAWDAWRPGMVSWYGFFFVAGLASAWVCLQEEFFLASSAVALLLLSVALPSWAACAIMASGMSTAMAVSRQFPRQDVSWKGVAIVGLAFALIFGIYVRPFAAAAIQRGFSSRQTPQGALNFLEANQIGGRMFNDMGTASYLLWKGQPTRPVFVDDRGDVYEEKFLEDARAWTQRWRLLDSVYRFDYAVVENSARGYPCRALDEDPSWALAYWDDAALVYLRLQPSHEKILKRHTLRRLRPNNIFDPVVPGALADKASAQETLAELDRDMLYAPKAVSPLLIKALVLGRLGMTEQVPESLNAALARGFWKPELSVLLGLVLEERADSETALSNYRRALKASRQNHDRLLAGEISARIAAVESKIRDH